MHIMALISEEEFQKTAFYIKFDRMITINCIKDSILGVQWVM